MSETEKTEGAGSEVAAEDAFQTGAEVAGIDPAVTVRTDPSLSYSPDLEEVPDSTAPALADGTAVAHVHGPQQAAVDPIAAGLDTGAVVPTIAENRAITRTGEIGAGPRPETYVEKGVEVPQAAPADNATVAIDPDASAPGDGKPTEEAVVDATPIPGEATAETAKAAKSKKGG